MTSLLRLWLAAIIALAVALPSVSAALAEIVPVPVRSVVICTGEGLATIRLDGAGNPVGAEPRAQHCALVHAADTSVPPVATQGRPALSAPRARPARRRIAVRPPSFRHGARAPPVK